MNSCSGCFRRTSELGSCHNHPDREGILDKRFNMRLCLECMRSARVLPTGEIIFPGISPESNPPPVAKRSIANRILNILRGSDGN
jgi:hypothetical protein